MSISQLILLAVLAESIWETLKMVWQKGKFHFDMAGALAIGVVLALATGLDLFELLGLPVKIPYLGQIFTGLLISRGANFLHDLLKITQVTKTRMNNSAGSSK